MKLWPLIFCMLFIAGENAHSYFPINCNDAHAESDYLRSDAVIVGRVIKLDRARSEYEFGKSKRRMVEYAYFATVKVARAVRGILNQGDEIRILEGVSTSGADDDAAPLGLYLCGTHMQAGFCIGQTYLLFVKQTREQRDGVHVWSLRSCHESIIPIASRWESEQVAPVVRFRKLNNNELEVEMALDEFLKQKQSDAEDAIKNEKP